MRKEKKRRMRKIKETNDGEQKKEKGRMRRYKKEE